MKKLIIPDVAGSSQQRLCNKKPAIRGGFSTADEQSA
jgi:hypothetical protein